MVRKSLCHKGTGLTGKAPGGHWIFSELRSRTAAVELLKRTRTPLKRYKEAERDLRR
jgi:hypothetical protein